GRWLLERAGILARGEAPDPEAGLVGAGAGLPGETAGSPPGGPPGLPGEPAGIPSDAGPPGGPAGIPGDAGAPGEGAGIAGAGGTLGEPAGSTEEAGVLGEPAGITGGAGVLGEVVSLPGAAWGEGEPGGGGIAVVFQEVARNAAAGACLKLGRILADRAPRVALLAMGDSCARPAREDPDVPDPAAEDYDEEVAEALAAADARGLARLDPPLDGGRVGGAGA